MNSLIKFGATCSLVGAALIFIAGCEGQSNPPPAGSPLAEARVFVGNTNGTVSVIDHGDGVNPLASPIDLFSSVGDMVSSTKNHIFVNMGGTNQTAALDPVGTTATFSKFIQVGQRPVHIYREVPDGSRIWVLNDGDATTGVDTVTAQCNTNQVGSVSVIQNHDEGGDDEGNAGEVLATICVGKGHHKATFSYPTEDHPDVPLRAFISNIIDGTIEVIDNDPDSDDYLTVIGTIDLCDSAKETCPATPNGAGPHGMVYSQVSEKIYNNNEDYGTVNVIDPETNSIDATLDLLGFAGASYITPDGSFVLVRGSGKLTVIDVSDPLSFEQTDLPGISPGDLVFTPDSEKLYMAATESSGNVVLVFELSALPDLPDPIVIPVGSAGARTIAIHEHDGEAEHVFVANRVDGTVSVIDPETNTVVDSIQVGGGPTCLLVFALEGDLDHH